MNREDARILVRKTFLMDLGDEEAESLVYIANKGPEEFVNMASNKEPSLIWNKIPSWINENLGWDDGIEDMEDVFRWDFDAEEITYVGGLKYYFDKNQWMFNDEKYRPDPNHGHPWDIETLSSELVVVYSNAFGSPMVKEIYLGFNIDGNAEEFEIFPKCTFTQYMSKIEIKDFLGLED